MTSNPNRHRERNVFSAGTGLSMLVRILPALALVACEPTTNVEQATTTEERHGAVAQEVHWGYEGEEAPVHWADLQPEFAQCRSGVEQSPIDLTGAVSIESAGFQRRLGETVLTGAQRALVLDLVDNGHTIQVSNNLPMSIELGDRYYELVQFHFHGPSEHTIDGEHSPLEVHFVHRSEAGELAVVSILVEEGAHDELWEPLIASLPAAPGDSRHVEGLDLDIKKLRPLASRFYRYTGSLTTPPCSEGVEWIVMAEQREISAQQMSAIVSHLHNNNRPVQPLGERKIGLVWE